MSFVAPRESDFHKKDMLSMKHWLLGRNFFVALFCMEWVSLLTKDNMRKDKVTPEFNHQISIANYVRTLDDYLSYPEETYCAIFLHDLCEDYDVSFEEVRLKLKEQIDNSSRLYTKELKIDVIIQAVVNLTKVYKKNKKDATTYFNTMISDPVASIVKGADRIHNITTMVDVFNNKKKKEYLKEMEDYILPMLKESQKKHPQQNLAYENMKLVLKIQSNTIKYDQKLIKG